jgi:EF hand
MKTALAKFLLFAMVMAILSCSSTEKTLENQPPAGAPPGTDETFAKFDTNKDGKLSADEVKGPLKKDFAKIDTNGDGFISKEELNKVPKRNRKGPPRGGQGGQQGPPSNRGN